MIVLLIVASVKFLNGWNHLRDLLCKTESSSVLVMLYCMGVKTHDIFRIPCIYLLFIFVSFLCMTQIILLIFIEDDLRINETFN